jgi:hypothetical protein
MPHADASGAERGTVGFFKDLRTLSKQGQAVRDQYPTQQIIANASAQMSAVSAMLAQANDQVDGGRLATEGFDTTAIVTAARQTNALMNHNPMIALDLLVTMPSGVPVPVQHTVVVPLLHLARVQVGSRLTVRVDPLDPSTLRIDWA